MKLKQYISNGERAIKLKRKKVYDYEYDDIIKQIELREKWKTSVKNLERNIKQLEKALGKELLNEYEKEF